MGYVFLHNKHRRRLIFGINTINKNLYRITKLHQYFFLSFYKQMSFLFEAASLQISDRFLDLYLSIVSFHEFSDSGNMFQQTE